MKMWISKGGKPGYKVYDKNSEDSDKYDVMKDRILEALLDIFHLRLYGQRSSQYQKTEHHLRLYGNPSFEVHEELAVVPQEISQDLLQKIASYKFSDSRYRSTRKEDEHRSFYLELTYDEHYDQHGKAVYGKPRTLEESAVKELTVLVDHDAPYTFVQPSYDGIYEKPFYAVSYCSYLFHKIN